MQSKLNILIALSFISNINGHFFNINSTSVNLANQAKVENHVLLPEKSNHLIQEFGSENDLGDKSTDIQGSEATPVPNPPTTQIPEINTNQAQPLTSTLVSTNSVNIIGIQSTIQSPTLPAPIVSDNINSNVKDAMPPTQANNNILETPQVLPPPPLSTSSQLAQKAETTQSIASSVDNPSTTTNKGNSLSANTSQITSNVNSPENKKDIPKPSNSVNSPKDTISSSSSAGSTFNSNSSSNVSSTSISSSAKSESTSSSTTETSSNKPDSTENTNSSTVSLDNQYKRSSLTYINDFVESGVTSRKLETNTVLFCLTILIFLF